MPTLAKGDIVILDTLGNHKGQAVRRTVEATWRKAGELLDAFPPAECADYLRISGYASV
ncbi:transposase [Shinella daejeonensis]|uniref:hypothetical protein n=1 Tax=Shinella daejeonensis TaxID=659017 RepID=UPI003F5CC2E3|nr:transposase [Shinella daejeonensis]